MIGIGIILVVSMAVSTLIAVLLERIAYRPLRNAPRLVPLITAIGASFFLQYTFRGFYGSGTKGYPAIKVLEEFWTVAGVHIYKTQVVVIVGAIFNDDDPLWRRPMDEDRESHARCFRGQGSRRTDGDRR